MTKQFFKTVLAGILAGVLIFMMPFLIIKVLIVFLLIRAIFRLMGGGGYRKHWRYAYAHKYQNMSEEERKAFMHDNAQHWARSCVAGNRCGWSYKDDLQDTAGSDEKDKTNNV